MNLSTIFCQELSNLVRIFLLAHARTRTRTHTYMHTYTHTCTRVHKYIRIFIHAYTCIHTYKHARTHLYSYIHIRTKMPVAIVGGNTHVEPRSKPGRGCLHFMMPLGKVLALFIIKQFSLQLRANSPADSAFQLWYGRWFWRRYYLPTPPLGQDMTQGRFLSGV